MEGANKKKSNQKGKGYRKGNYESWFTNVRLHVRSIFGATGNSVSLVNHKNLENTTVDQPADDSQSIIRDIHSENERLHKEIHQVTT